MKLRISLVSSSTPSRFFSMIHWGSMGEVLRNDPDYKIEILDQKVCEDEADQNRFERGFQLPHFEKKTPGLLNVILAHPFYTDEEKDIEHKKATKKYREKGWAKTVIDCKCGTTYTLGHAARHKKSKFHKRHV